MADDYQFRTWLVYLIQWYKLIQTSKEINACLQKLFSGNEMCDDDTDDDTVDADRQHDPCVCHAMQATQEVREHTHMPGFVNFI